MSRFFNRKSIAFVLVALALVASFFGTVAIRGSATNSHAAAPKVHPKGVKVASSRGVKTASGTYQNTNAICQLNGHSIELSSGGQMFCLGPQPNGPGGNSVQGHKKNTFSPNVNAASLSEDTINGTRAYGQSEESVAGSGPYVVEAWNDSTGFFATCGAPMNKEELTGFGFSNNGGASFTDLGGLPNSNCANSQYFGDPSVEVHVAGGGTYFYISSLFFCFSGTCGTPPNTTTDFSNVAMAVCTVLGSGSSATLSCSQPNIIARSTFGFLDKDFMTIEHVNPLGAPNVNGSGRLYASYTNFFGNSPTFSNITIDVGACDIGTSTGGTGNWGGTPGTPICNQGSTPGLHSWLQLTGTNPGCTEDQGSYPASDLATGDLYVGYEFNWPSFFCTSFPALNVANFIPYATCLNTPPSTDSPCQGDSTPSPSCAAFFTCNNVAVVSMASAFVPGYNRFPANDFPRIAVSDPFGTVSLVWNDSRFHALGDILLQSFSLVSLAGVQAAPVQINNHVGGLHFLPALRNVDDDGDLQISWYERATGSTTLTNVFAAIDVSPTTVSTPASIKVTTAPTNWVGTSSDIIPNFGDYTDNYVNATATAPFTAQTLSVAWADGRIGEPQPFYASAHTN